MSSETDFVPFNKPHVSGREYVNIADAVACGHVSGDGHYTAVCTEMLRDLTGVPNVLLTTSCTHALEMCALLLDVVPGDEIILPSFTFVSTANAFVLRGAKPVFVDIRRDTLNIDEAQLEDAITERTRAIVVVHYAGVACEMDQICEIAGRRNVPVIEDAAHALGASYRGRPLGSFGALSTLSFHETKNIHCGEGGALLVNRRDLMDRAEIIREKGTNRSQFFRGQVDKYTWCDVGSSYLPSDILAAFLAAQLGEFDRIQAKRSRVWSTYADQLRDWAADREVGLPIVPDEAEHSAHLFYVMLPDLDHRQRFIAHLAAQRIHAVFHYVPLHLSPLGRRLGADDAVVLRHRVCERSARTPAALPGPHRVRPSAGHRDRAILQ